MHLNASLMREQRVAVATAGWMLLLLHLNTAALKDTCNSCASNSTFGTAEERVPLQSLRCGQVDIPFAALSPYCLCQVLNMDQYASVSTNIFLCCIKYQDIQEVVLRKLYKAWDSDNDTVVAVKLEEMYGFAAASAWADQHLAVPSLLVGNVFLDGRTLQALQHRNTFKSQPIVVQLLCLSFGR